MSQTTSVAKCVSFTDVFHVVEEKFVSTTDLISLTNNPFKTLWIEDERTRSAKMLAYFQVKDSFLLRSI